MKIAEGKVGKEQIANAVFTFVNQWTMDPHYEVTKMSPLWFRIRYKPEENGPSRYFTVRVGESL
jgi:hypothetical protein